MVSTASKKLGLQYFVRTSTSWANAHNIFFTNAMQCVITKRKDQRANFATASKSTYQQVNQTNKFSARN